ncbi:MAG: rhodanese-like domain-containing protein [Bacteroidales bacterium]|nr:rhodanese-like domain-containing protein [Bacteroidales bacterium]
MKKVFYAIAAVVLLAVVPALAVSLHRSYRIADIISDEAYQDELSMKDTVAYRSLSVEEYELALQDSSVVRLDVRSEQERKDDGFIPGTVCIDVQEDDFLLKACEILPKEKTIAVNCRSGRRSKIAAEMLAGKGYTVIELDGGFNAWKEAGKPVVIE